MPDHSRLSRLRERFGLAVCRRFCATLVAQWIAAGLVWGPELYIAATKVAANAARASLHPRCAVEAHRAHLCAAEGGADDGGEGSGDPHGEGGIGAPPRVLVDLPRAAQAALDACAAGRQDWIGKAGRPHRQATSGTSRRTADLRLSTTDPDATPRPHGDGRTHLG